MFGSNQNKKDTIESDVKEFRDEAGLSTRQLDWGLWFVRHRKKSVLLTVWILAIIGAGTVIYSLYSLGYYLIVGRAQDQQLYQQLTNTPVVAPTSSSDLPLSYGSPRILLNAGTRGDIIIPVTNPNSRATARFSYYFLVSGEKIGERSDFIAPGETKYLMALGETIPAGAADASLVVENYLLKRFDAHMISDWQSYQAERLNFKISETLFVPGAQSGLSEKISVGELSFKIANQSPYGYRSLRLIILLKSNGEIVAANDYRLENFRSGEARSPRISWTGNVPVVNQIEIIPDLDIQDESAYLKYSAL